MRINGLLSVPIQWVFYLKTTIIGHWTGRTQSISRFKDLLQKYNIVKSLKEIPEGMYFLHVQSVEKILGLG
ncbi:MAG: hypothetical protein R2827_11070 [Bdellovibrionales bacterium]